MEKTFRVIDLHNIYKEIYTEVAFLVLGSEGDMVEASSVIKKIRVASKRFLNLRYAENEEVRVVLKNADTEEYEVVKVPCKNGVYGLCNVLTKYGIRTRLEDYETWLRRRDYYTCDEEKLIISDTAMLLDGTANTDKKELFIIGELNVENTKLCLKKVIRYNLGGGMEDDLFGKCLRGESISVSDFFELVDCGFPIGAIHIDFGNLKFEITFETILLKKVIREYKMDEEINCIFYKDRFVIPSMFFAYALKAESEKQLLKGIDEYFICGR